MEVTHQKQIFVVLGMSRSGTSAIARALKVFGIDLGEKLLPGDSRNPKGFFEDSDILYKINRGVSNALNYPWLSFAPLQNQLLQENPALIRFQHDAIEILENRFAKTQWWGFKDPRTVNILPFWHSVFNALKLSDRYIIVVRNPLAAAYSNYKFAQIDIEVGLIIWLNTFMSAIEMTHGKLRSLVSYELMLRNPRLQLLRMHDALSIGQVINEDEVNRYAQEFIDPSLSHHQHSESELRSHPSLAIAPLCLEAYDLLMLVAQDQLSFNDTIFQERWQKIKEQFKKIYPVYDFIRVLHLRNKQLERELRAIKKSVFWKMNWPIRSMKRMFHKIKGRRKQEIMMN